MLCVPLDHKIDPIMIRRVVRTMLNTPPYDTWPLRVTLFHEEAVKEWKAAANSIPNLPDGFTFDIQLEGVDGKSGMPGTGRVGPLDVVDCEL